MKKNSIIVTHFSGGDGGNFLISALSMSDHCGIDSAEANYLSDSPLENRDIKYRYWKSRAEKNKTVYDDVNLWTGYIGTLEADGYKYVTPEKYSELRKRSIAGFKDLRHYIFKYTYPKSGLIDWYKNEDGVVQSLHHEIDSERQEFIDFIEKDIINTVYKISTKTNCFNIVFENPVILIALRHYYVGKGINAVSRTCGYRYRNKYHPFIDFDIDEELNSLTVSEYQALPKEKKDFFKDRYNFSYKETLSCMEGNKYHRFYDNLSEYFNNPSFIWDVNWYLSEDDTANNVKRLYDVLGFDDYDDDTIRNMYRVWIESLDSIVCCHREVFKDKDNSQWPEKL